MRRMLRSVVVACWVAVVIILLRIASGGGPGGPEYVVRVEPGIAIALGLGLVLSATVLAVVLALDGSRRAFVASAIVAAVALAYGLFLVADRHDSGQILILATTIILVISIRSVRRAEEHPPGG